MLVTGLVKYVACRLGVKLIHSRSDLSKNCSSYCEDEREKSSRRPTSLPAMQCRNDTTGH